VFHDAGLANYHIGKVEQAKYYLTAALTLNRQFPKALNNYGCLEFSSGNTEIAMNAVYEAAHLKPKDVIYWGNAWVIA
jgi:tetratricopeptide (TPR) repeat protein